MDSLKGKSEKWLVQSQKPGLKLEKDHRLRKEIT